MELAKGVKDEGLKESLLREEILSVIKKYFQRYGFNQLNTPIIEREETLTSKYAGGEEILKEIYTLKDQGERKLALRYDLTVPLVRYINMNPNIKLPFKRYQIGRVFRDGPIKTGRYREFTQCDADVVGSADVYTEAELLKLASDVFEELKLEVVIKVNDRKLLNGILEKNGIKDKEGFILTLDKLEKIGEDGVKKELKSKGYDNIDNVLEIVKKDFETLKKEYPEETEDLTELFNYNKNKNIKFSPTLARGLAYYTGIVYEVFTKELKSSIASGGRYDNIIGSYSNKDYPAVGFSFGLDAIASVIKEEKETATDLFVIPINTFEESLKIVEDLRKDINVDVNLPNKNIKKGLSYASYYKIPYALIIGEDELKNKKYTLRDMNSGKEQKLTKEEIKKFFS